MVREWYGILRHGLLFACSTNASWQIQPGNIEVSTVACFVSNGQVVSGNLTLPLMHLIGGSFADPCSRQWILKSARNYS